MMAQTMAPPAAAPIAMPTMTPVDRLLEELDEPDEPDESDEPEDSAELVALRLYSVCVMALVEYEYWPSSTLEQSAAADEKTSMTRHTQVSNKPTTKRPEMPPGTYSLRESPHTQPRHTQTSPPQWHWRSRSRTRTRSRRAGSPSTW